MQEMHEELEQLLLCESLAEEDRDCVEQALDDGYLALPAPIRARVRRLLNRQAARPVGALQRYRLRRLAGLALLAAHREATGVQSGSHH